MGRQGFLEYALRGGVAPAVVLCFGGCVLLLAAPPGYARQDSPAVTNESANEPIERRPYRISLHMAFDPSARIDLLKRADLIREWQILVRRFIGPPWVVSIEI